MGSGKSKEVVLQHCCGGSDEEICIATYRGTWRDVSDEVDHELWKRGVDLHTKDQKILALAKYTCSSAFGRTIDVSFIACEKCITPEAKRYLHYYPLGWSIGDPKDGHNFEEVLS